MGDMALNIKSPEADRLARELTAATGESLTTAVETALRERLERERGRGRSSKIKRRLHALSVELDALPVIDSRSAEAILGYDEHGLPS
jgi:antitoxin VapB